ncbi:MAG: glycosyltransferase [Anaerolineae bacterium]|nr:MAG: glycosyltransferase [Anaerolineae bacterium]
MPTIAIVLPVYNEGEIIERTHARLRAVVDALPYPCTIYYVDDGSTDDTPRRLAALAETDARVEVITLSRNFGHQAALTAGLDLADGDIVITLDADGQHPPELIPQMIDLVRQGYDVVQTQRMDEYPGFSFKRWTSAAFYALINRISGTHIAPGTADFRALSRRAVDALRKMPEYHRFLRGMVAWMGFPTVILPYHPAERVGGKSKYSLRKMVKLAMDAIFSFSLVPLYIGVSLGGLMLLLALAEMVYVLSFWVTGRQDSLAPGWSSLMFVILIVGGMLMIVLGFIGVYVGYIFQEVKRRPVYLIRERKRVSPRASGTAQAQGEEEVGKR